MKIARNELKMTSGMIFFCLLLCGGCSQKPDVNAHENQETQTSAVSYETEASQEIIIEVPSAAPETVPATMEEWLPYGEKHDFNIQPLSGFISQGIIYSGLNPWQDYKVTDCEVTVDEVTINEEAGNEAAENEITENEAAKNGAAESEATENEATENGKTGNAPDSQEAFGVRKNLKIRFTAVMWEEYTRDGRKLWECMTPTLQLCDYYTGLIFPERDTKGTDGFEAMAHLGYEDKEYEVNYSCEVAYSQGDWEVEPDGGYRRPVTFEIVYEVTAPKEYDGLMLCVTPVTEYEPADAAEVNDTERYIGESSADELLLYRIETSEDETPEDETLEDDAWKDNAPEDETSER